jgi:hypothetical protein
MGDWGAAALPPIPLGPISLSAMRHREGSQGTQRSPNEVLREEGGPSRPPFRTGTLTVTQSTCSGDNPLGEGQRPMA